MRGRKFKGEEKEVGKEELKMGEKEEGNGEKEVKEKWKMQVSREDPISKNHSVHACWCID